MAKKRENKFLSFIAVIIIIVFVGAIFVVIKSEDLNHNQYISNNQPASSQIYKSKSLKLTINVPVGFQVEEKFTAVNLKIDKREIKIDRIGTNFNNIESYLNNLEEKNKIEIADRKKNKINLLDSIESMIRHPVSKSRDEKAYFIYADNWVYSLSTSSEELFDDLDQIAQSFKYTP